jgi:anti-sigma B factor antagonist
MSSFEIASSQVADATSAWLLTVTGDFDTTAMDGFDRAIDAVMAQGARLVTVDLSDVSFLDSSGLRSVVHAANRLTQVDGRLTVAGLSGAAQRVLEISGLIDQLTSPDGNHTANTDP